LSCEQGEKRLNPWFYPSANHTMCPPITDCVHQSQTVSTSHRLCPPVTRCVHQSQRVSTNHRMCSPITDCVHQSQDVFINHRLRPPIGINLKIRRQGCVYHQLHYECKMRPSPSCSVISLDFGLTGLDSACFSVSVAGDWKK
jgi:hypothetical protein